jgi:putative ABC transport system substrate-binding protein
VGSLTSYLEALRQGLAEQKLTEGAGVEVLYRYGNDDLALVPQLARELVAGGAELLIVQGAAIPDVLKLNLPLPIVFVTSGDPIAAGFAKSLTGTDRQLHRRHIHGLNSSERGSNS